MFGQQPQHGGIRAADEILPVSRNQLVLQGLVRDEGLGIVLGDGRHAVALRQEARAITGLHAQVLSYVSTSEKVMPMMIMLRSWQGYT